VWGRDVKTDLEKVKQLFTELGIGWEEAALNQNTIIRCHEGQARINGYSFFFTDFTFDVNGTFLEMGAYE
jgi:hypothetical protein